MATFFIPKNSHRQQPITSSDLAYLQIHPLISFTQEEVWIACLNSHKQIIENRCLFRGSVDQCPIHPREIFHYAIKNLSSSFILFHSHPSGHATPSKEDKKITRQILSGSKLLRIKMVDHIIVTKSSYFSFLDEELIF